MENGSSAIEHQTAERRERETRYANTMGKDKPSSGATECQGESVQVSI